MGEDAAGGIANLGRHSCATSACGSGRLVPRPRGALDLGGAQQLLGAAGHRAHALLTGAHCEAGFHLGLAGRSDLGLQRVALAGVGLGGFVGLRLGQVQPLFEARQAGQVVIAGGLGGAAGLVEAGGLAGRLS